MPGVCGAFIRQAASGIVAATLTPRLAPAIDSEPPRAAILSRRPVNPKPVDAARVARAAAAVVLDMAQQGVFRALAPLDPEHDAARRTVPQRVGQAFLNHPVGGRGDGAADGGEIALEIEL